MHAIFDTCLNQCYEQRLQPVRRDLALKSPEPIKFKLAKSLNLFDPLLRNFALPHRKEQYKFPRKNLYFLETQTNSIPFVYSSTPNPSQSVLFIYCHGSGSTLNHVYEFSNNISWKFNVASIAYDYTGDGQSQKQFKDFQSDLKCILAWAVRQGYDLRRIILCGFSLGSYSALCLKGQMPRILISPLCGLTSYIEGRPVRYEGEKFDNLGKALELRSKTWITHCTKQLIPIQHSKMLYDAMLKNNSSQEILFTQIKDPSYDHKSAPGFLFSEQGTKILSDFVSKTLKTSKQDPLTDQTKGLKAQLLQIAKNINVKTGLQKANKRSS